MVSSLLLEKAERLSSRIDASVVRAARPSTVYTLFWMGPYDLDINHA